MILEHSYDIPFAAADGDEVWAIGDIHGASHLLRALLDHIAATPAQGRRVLVQTGDLIDRGPDSLGTIDLMRGVGQQVDVKQLMGNHEQMLLVALHGHEERQRRQAYGLWIDNGGDGVLREIHGDYWNQTHSFEAMSEDLGVARVDYLRRSLPYYRNGEVLFVHAGVSRSMPLDRFLTIPWEVNFNSLDEDLHWAWIRWPFLNRPHGHELFVVHGHTPQDGIRRVGAATVADDRLNLDVGSYFAHSARAARFVGNKATVFDVIANGED